MSTIASLLKRIFSVFRKDRYLEELQEEMDFHVATRAEKYVAGGMSPSDALKTAQKEFGSPLRYQEQGWHQWAFLWEDEMLQDIRHGIRLLLKNRVFTAVAVLSLALGIGANTALFSLIDAVLLRKLPVPNPDELVVFDSLTGPNRMMGGHSGYGGRDPVTSLNKFSSFSRHTFNQLHANQQALASIFAFAPVNQLNVNIDGVSEMAFGQVVSGDYFAGLGVQAGLGRTIAPADDDAAASPVAVISYQYWQRRFRADPSAVGKIIKVNSLAFTIAGITPKEFSGSLQVGQSPDISLPLSVAPLTGDAGQRSNQPWFWWLRVMGRLQQGVNAEQARVSLQPIFAQSALDGWNALPPERKITPEAQQARDTPLLRVTSGSRGLNEERDDLGKVLGIFLALLGIVLLIACANVANLLLARSAARRQEIAMRIAIGASRGRLVRQLLSESVLLALCAGVLGIVFAYWGTSAIPGWTRWTDRTIDLQINLNVLGFTFALSVATGILFGLMPAFRATRLDLTPSIKEGSRNFSGRRRLVSKTLLIGQVGLSVLLLMAAGLFVRTLHRLQNVNVGFNKDNLLLFKVGPGASNYPESQIARLYEDLLHRIEAVPGVQSATASTMTLLAGGSWMEDYLHVRGSEFEPADRQQIYRLGIAPNFFDTLEIPLQAGRQLTARDNSPDAPRVAVINQRLAKRFFEGRSPLGSHIGFGRPGTGPELEIVGVVADAKYDRLRNDPMIVYTPYAQNIRPQMTFEVRTSGDPNAFIPPVREAVSQIDANLPMVGITTQDNQIKESVSFERLFAVVAGSFGSLALLLAAVGLYGILSYNVTRRTNEIGIRIALGAPRWSVVRIVMLETLTLAGAGVILGVLLLAVVSQLLGGVFPPSVDLSRDVLMGSPMDPLTLAAVIGMMLAVAALATYLPARRACRVDPTVALRYE
jgi:predicted permease